MDSHLDIRRELLSEAKDELKFSGILLLSGEFYKQGKVVINKLLKESAISYPVYWVMVGDGKIEEKMLQKNVFSHHYNADVITFQSTPMKQYCEQHPELLKGR
jgi:hypothetical protein